MCRRRTFRAWGERSKVPGTCASNHRGEGIPVGKDTQVAILDQDKLATVYLGILKMCAIRERGL